jgi:hypothetical protein
MITALILGLSVMALLQFFVSYCRSLIAASVAVPLSEQVREVAGIGNRHVSGEEFSRLLQLARLCPEPGNDNRGLEAVRMYFKLLNMARAASRRIAPNLVSWTERERSGCAYFVAIALERRIAHSRGLMAQALTNNC